MWKDLLRLLTPGSSKPGQLPPAPPMPDVPRDAVEHLWHRVDGGLPRVDWNMAERWIADQLATDPAAPDNPAPTPTHTPEAWRRAIMAASLDELRDALKHDHRRWQTLHIEGLAPLGDLGPEIARIAERTCAALHRELAPIRADHSTTPNTTTPIPPVAVVLIEPYESLIDYTSSYHPDEGEFATFGGLYINQHQSTIAIIAINAQVRHNCAAAVVHELTHHALADCNLPLWVEEGITQMMEERHANEWRFTLNHELLARQHNHWDDAALESFLDGWAFSSAENDTQELAYHLAQWVVRTMLEHDAKAFFTFARACRTTIPDEACRTTLGASQRELIKRAVGLGD